MVSNAPDDNLSYSGCEKRSPLKYCVAAECHQAIINYLEAVMKRKQKIHPHQQLINHIHAETRMRGWTLADTADLIGISYIYMASLTNGARKLSGLSLGKQRKLAKFLGISLVEFFLGCGMLRPEDLMPGAPA